MSHGITTDELHIVLRKCSRAELELIRDLPAGEQGVILLAKLLFDGTIGE